MKLTQMKWHLNSLPSMAFKEAMRKGDSIILEPFMKSRSNSTRRVFLVMLWAISTQDVSKLEGMEMAHGAQIIKAHVPLSEMFGYATS